MRIAEPAFGGVQLPGRHSEVEQHAVQRAHAHFVQVRTRVFEIVADERHSVKVLFQPLPSRLVGVFVTVDGDEPSVCRQSFGYRKRVSSASHSAVEINPVGSDAERFYAFAEHNGLVRKFHLTPRVF